MTDNFNIPSFCCIFVSRLITSIEKRNVQFFTFVFSVKGMISVILITLLYEWVSQFCAERRGWVMCFLSDTFPNAPAQTPPPPIYFLQTTHFVKSRAHSPRPTSKIIAMIALRRAILMKVDPVVSLHANRVFSGRACSCKKDHCSPYGRFSQNQNSWMHRLPNFLTHGAPLRAQQSLCPQLARAIRGGHKRKKENSIINK